MARTFLAALLCLSLPALSDEALGDETVQYLYLNQGKVEGGQTVVYRGTGAVEVDFGFNDRGRGPKLHEVFTLDSQGLLTATTITGNSYLGAAVNETFASDGDGVRWRNGIDDDRRPPRGKTWYVSMNGTREAFAAMVRAALRQPGQKLALLPSGELTVKKVKTIEVPVGDKKANANLYTIHGLGLIPDTLWLTDELRYIGFASDWNSLILVGWESALPILKTEAETVERSFYADLSKQATRKAPKRLRVKNVRVLDVEASKLGKAQDVWIQDGKFIAEPSRKDKKEIENIDAKGAVMMPGLWDMHSHLFDSSAIMNIACGVTSVRDLGNSKDQISDLIARIGKGEIVGPNVYRAALIDAESPFRAPAGDIAKTQDEALSMIDATASQGILQLKLYSSIPPEWVPALTKRAHARGMRVSGHVPAFMTAESAVRAGYDEIQHINMLFLNFLTNKTDDTRLPLRFTLVGDKAGYLDLQSQPVKDFLKLLREKKTVIDPTLGIFVAMFSHEKGKPDPSIAAIADHFPPTVQRNQLQPEMEINDQNRDAYKRSADALERMVKMLYENSIPLVAGTDHIAGFALHRELELYVEAGIPVGDVLRIATVNAAKLVGAGDSKGQIKPGFDADWILMQGNPLEDIRVQRNIVLVMKGDTLYCPSRIFTGLSIKPFVAAASH